MELNVEWREQASALKQVAVARKADVDAADGRILAMHAESVEQTLATMISMC